MVCPARDIRFDLQAMVDSSNRRGRRSGSRSGMSRAERDWINLNRERLDPPSYLEPKNECLGAVT